MVAINRLSIAISLIVAGCALPEPIIQFQTVPLPIPELTDWPNIPADDLQCISDGVYVDIAARDDAKSHRIKVLTSVLCSSHENPERCMEHYAPD